MNLVGCRQGVAPMKHTQARTLLRVCLVLVAGTPALAALTPQEVLDDCMANPQICALSVTDLTGGWERHWNGDRVQVTASTFKVLTLITYAEAVAKGQIDPGLEVARDDWARFWTGIDADALQNAWNRLGQPQTVTVDQMVGAMIRESDNAAPDWLLDRLGERAFDATIKRYVRGYHDRPHPIGAMFLSWFWNVFEPGSGERIAADYSGFAAAGYRSEVADLFALLHDPTLADAARAGRCAVFPWLPPPPCVPPPLTSFETLRKLAAGYFTRATTRTYNRLMAGLLRGDLLPVPVAEIVRKHLEWRLEDAAFAALYTHFAAKGGELAIDIRNATAYFETHGGDQGVVSIFHHHLPPGGLSTDDMRGFVREVALNPSFRATIKNTIPVATPKPQLVLRTTAMRKTDRKGGSELVAKVEVTNVGTAPALGPFDVSLYLSDDAQLDPTEGPLAARIVGQLRPDKTVKRRLRAVVPPSASGRFAIVAVDSNDVVGESVEDDNVVAERIP
jgi:hypothetical protein